MLKVWGKKLDCFFKFKKLIYQIGLNGYNKM